MLIQVVDVYSLPVIFPSCPECMSKLNTYDRSDNRNIVSTKWLCVKCHQVHVGESVYKFRLKMRAVDFKTRVIHELTVFGKSISQVVGCSAIEFNRLHVQHNEHIQTHEGSSKSNSSEVLLFKALRKILLGHFVQVQVAKKQADNSYTTYALSGLPSWIVSVKQQFHNICSICRQSNESIKSQDISMPCSNVLFKEPAYNEMTSADVRSKVSPKTHAPTDRKTDCSTPTTLAIKTDIAWEDNSDIWDSWHESFALDSFCKLNVDESSDEKYDSEVTEYAIDDSRNFVVEKETSVEKKEIFHDDDDFDSTLDFRSCLFKPDSSILQVSSLLDEMTVGEVAHKPLKRLREVCETPTMSPSTRKQRFFSPLIGSNSSKRMISRENFGHLLSNQQTSTPCQSAHTVKCTQHCKDNNCDTLDLFDDESGNVQPLSQDLFSDIED